MMRRSLFSKTLLAGLTAMVVLTGCESLGFNEYSKRNDESSALLARIEALREHNVPDKVERIEQPPVRLTPLASLTDTAYLSQPVHVSMPVSGSTLSAVLNDALSQAGKQAWYGDGVNPRLALSLGSYHGPLSGLLNQIERQLNVGFTPKGDTLRVERFVSRTFELELPPGMISDQLGGESTGSESGEEGSANVAGQYVKLSSSDVDVFSEVAEGVRALLKTDTEQGDSSNDNEELVGSVQSIPALSRLVVRTTPSRMAEVVDFVHDTKASLTRQVALEIQILEFRSNIGHNRGIEWDLVKDLGRGEGLQFFIPGTDLLSQTASPGFAFTGGGKWSGSTALINALNQQGQVSAQTPVTIMVQNHQTNHITQDREVEFLENISSDSSEGVISTDTERGKRVEGVDFIVVPNIQPSHVYLRTSGMLTKIESLESQVVGGETLIFPQMRKAKINFANKLKYGQTIVIGSVSQIDTITESNTFLGIPFLGGNSAVKQRVDTLVLLTPRRADG